MIKFSDWINRMRHNRGFGVQSPTAFFFVTQVLKEKLPYYAYGQIDRIAALCGTHSNKMCRRLFRVANYLRPKSIIAIGNGAAAPLCALAAAASSAHVALIATGSPLPPAAAQYLAGRESHLQHGTTLQQQLQAHTAPHLLFIDRESDITSALQATLPHACKGTAIIADGIHTSPERLKQWEKAVKSPQTIVTYDLYSFGILLFDNEKQKQHYTLKM